VGDVNLLDVDATPRPRSYRIRVAGADREIVCAADQDVLNAAIRAGVNWLKVGCRGGGCGICRVIVRSGDYVAGKMAKARIAAGQNGERYALACRIYPVSDLTIEPAPVGIGTAPSPTNT
jgi:ferredoxin